MFGDERHVLVPPIRRGAVVWRIEAHRRMSRSEAATLPSRAGRRPRKRLHEDRAERGRGGGDPERRAGAARPPASPPAPARRRRVCLRVAAQGAVANCSRPRDTAVATAANARWWQRPTPMVQPLVFLFLRRAQRGRFLNVHPRNEFAAERVDVKYVCLAFRRLQRICNGHAGVMPRYLLAGTSRMPYRATVR
jgi:hypothetical protein